MAAETPSPLQDQPVVLPTPFASARRATADDVPGEAEEGGPVCPNLKDGFPTAYGSPRSSSGAYVTRAQMNGIGRLLTTNETRKRLGGINTFNPSLVKLTGGYAKDAILDWWDERNQVLCKVISLRGDQANGYNTYDFTQRGADGYSVGPDGINWAICSPNGMWLPDYSNGTVLMPKTQIRLSTGMGYATGIYTMPFDGFLSVATYGEYKIPCSLFTAFDTSQAKITFTGGTWNTLISMFSMKIEGVLIKFYGVIPGDVYDKCRHNLYVALSSDGIFDVNMQNVIDGATKNAVVNVSSSGTDGSGGAMLIPARSGTQIRLFGQQTYSLAKSDTSLSPEGSVLQQHASTVMSQNSLASVGSMTLYSKIVAYPPTGPTNGD